MGYPEGKQVLSDRSEYMFVTQTKVKLDKPGLWKQVSETENCSRSGNFQITVITMLVDRMFYL